MVAKPVTDGMLDAEPGTDSGALVIAVLFKIGPEICVVVDVMNVLGRPIALANVELATSAVSMLYDVVLSDHGNLPAAIPV